MDLSLWMKENQTVKMIFPVNNGLFNHIDFDFGVDKQLLDVMFIGNFAMRNPSTYVEAIQDEYGEPLTDANLRTLGASLLALYVHKWTRLKEIPNIEYDPIHNYLDEWEDHSEGTETKTDTISSTREDELGTTRTHNATRTDNLSESVNGTRTDNLSETNSSTRTDNLLETEGINETESSSGSQADNIFGFNSSTASPSTSSSDSNSKTKTGTNTVADTGTQTVSSTKTNTGTQGNSETTLNTGTQTNAETIADTGTNTRTLDQTDELEGSDNRDRSGRHSGNIGNLTSQKMINEEIELWKWNYINSVLNDVKEFCTLPIYLKNRG